MRVIIAAGIFPPDIGGPATYTQKLATYLCAQGHTVEVVCYSDELSQDHYKFRVHRIKRRPFKVVTYVQYFFTLLKISNDADCIYAQGAVAGGLQSYVVSVVLRKRLAVKVVGDYAWEQGTARFGVALGIDEFQGATGIPFFVRVLRGVQRSITRRASIIIVPSLYLKSVVSKWGVQKSRIQVIYNAVSEPIKHVHGEAQMRERLKIEGPIILSVGRLVPWKGFNALIDVWPSISATHPAAHLVIVGSGPQQSSLAKAITDLHMESHIHLAGRKSAVELAGFYQSAYALVLNSGYEGLSHTVLEAQSYGVPCLVSRMGGNPEVVTDAQTGLLFEYDDRGDITEKIDYILSNPGAAKDYAVKAKVALRAFDYQTMLEQTATMLAALGPV